MQTSIQTDPTALDQLLEDQKGKTLKALKEMMVIDSPVQREQSAQLERRIDRICRPNRKENFSDNNDELHRSIFLKHFKETYTNQGFDVILQKKSNAQSKLSIRAVTSGMHLNFMQVVQELDEKQYQWKREELTNLKTKIQFQKWYKVRIIKQFNLKDGDICDLQVNLNSEKIKVTWLTTQGVIVDYYAKKNKSYKLKLHKVLQHLFIAEEDYFSLKGNNDFSKITEKRGILECGLWPYYQPTVGKRLGVNPAIYGEDESWLHRGDREWVVAFHGIGSPDHLMQKNQTRLGKILKQKLKPGSRQQFSTEKAVNTGQAIGRGIYFSPHFQTAMRYTTIVEIQGKSYSFLLQCRLNPKAILVCPGQEDYWVVRDPKDIRIYGVILIDQEDGNTYDPDPEHTYGQVFRYENYRCQIQNKWDEF